jgi:HEAT repeat protein
MGSRGALKTWLAWLIGTDVAKRREAVLALQSLTPDDAVPVSPLVQALGAQNDLLVFWSAIALGCLGRRAARAVPALARIANEHPQFGTRQAAVNALSRIAPGSREAKAAVMGALTDPNPFVRREALQALIAFKNLSVEELSRIKLLEHDPEQAVASWSEIALRNIRLRRRV